MKRNNVDAALIIEVSKPIAYGQYQFEKGDKLTYDMNSNLFIYRSESYSEDEVGTKTTSIITFGVNPDFVLDNADHFTCLIKKGILDKIEEDDQPEINDINETDTQRDTKQNDSGEDIDDKKMVFNDIIDHADKLSDDAFRKEVIDAMTLFKRILLCYDVALRKRLIGRDFVDSSDTEIERHINDTICHLNWALRAFSDEEKRAVNDCGGETCNSAR